jgi:hypothetical protein
LYFFNKSQYLNLMGDWKVLVFDAHPGGKPPGCILHLINYIITFFGRALSVINEPRTGAESSSDRDVVEVTVGFCSSAWPNNDRSRPI